MAIVLIYGCTVVLVNLVLPYGNHISIGSSDTPASGLERFFLFKMVSRLYLSIAPIRCGFSVIDERATLHQDVNENLALNVTLSLVVKRAREGALSDDDFVLDLANRLIHECDPNAFPEDDYSPIFYAIATQRADLVAGLIHAGADLAYRIKQSGKPVDGMNALDFARHLESRATDASSRTRFSQMAAMLEVSANTDSDVYGESKSR